MPPSSRGAPAQAPTQLSGQVFCLSLLHCLSLGGPQNGPMCLHPVILSLIALLFFLSVFPVNVLVLSRLLLLFSRLPSPIKHLSLLPLDDGVFPRPQGIRSPSVEEGTREHLPKRSYRASASPFFQITPSALPKILRDTFPLLRA